MANSSTVFSQLLQHLPRFEFQKIVDRQEGDKRVRRLTTWSQFVALLFGQLTGHNSLRAITAGLKSAKSKLFHLDIAGDLPTVLVLTDGRKHDIQVARKLSFPSGTFLLTWEFPTACRGV